MGKRAVVYFWPLLSREQQQEREEECVHAGYTDKRRITIREDVGVWRVT